jgi:hypothetical protein
MTNGPQSETVDNLGEALKIAEMKRNDGYHFVTMVSENLNMVGKQGAAYPGPGYTPQMLNP